MGRLLGIDYGLKRIGLAITDPCNIIASPFRTILTDEIFLFLEEVIKREDISTIVVGMPLNLDLTHTHSTEYVLNFVKELQFRFSNIDIIKFDERFTSKIALITIQNLNIKKSVRENKKNGIIDKISASLILQSYINSKKI